jgi:hypothetical protein
LGKIKEFHNSYEGLFKIWETSVLKQNTRSDWSEFENSTNHSVGGKNTLNGDILSQNISEWPK